MSAMRLSGSQIRANKATLSAHRGTFGFALLLGLMLLMVGQLSLATEHPGLMAVASYVLGLAILVGLDAAARSPAHLGRFWAWGRGHRPRFSGTGLTGMVLRQSFDGDTLAPTESSSRSVNPDETEAAGPEARGPAEEPPEGPREPFWNRQRATTVALLAATLLVAAGLRLVGLDWDQNQHLHPDERFITMVETKIQLPSSIDLYFDTARSPLNPYNNDFGSYIYGTLPLFFVRSVADAIQGITQPLTIPTDNPFGEFIAHLRKMSSYFEIHLLGRALSALADLLTICFVFLIGRRLFDTRVGLLAALLAAFTALQIQASHFFTAESTVTLFTAAAFYFALRAAQTGGMRDWAFVGVATGLAVASKITALMFGVVILAAAWAYWYRTRRVDTDERRRRYLVEDLITGLLITGVLVFVIFRVGQPYAFAGPGIFDIGLNPKWVQDVQVWQRFATGEADYPPGHQWAGTTPYLWQFTNMTLWGMGPPFSIAAWLGFMLGIVRLLRAPRTYFLYALPIIWIGINFLYWGPQLAKPMRYLLQIYPQLTVFAAFFVFCLWRWAGQRHAGDTPRLRYRLDRLRPWAARSAAIVVVGWTIFYGLAFTGIYTRPTTRVTASEWIYENVPGGAHIGWEHWDDPLPLRVNGRDSNIYTGVELPLYYEDTAEKRNIVLAKLDQADYIVLSSNRLYGSIPRLPQRYPMTVRYYQALFSGELGFDKLVEFTSRPSLFGIELNDDNAEEIFTVYEHPKVTIYKKSANYSSAQPRAILESVSLDNVLRGLRPVNVGSSGLLLSMEDAASDRAGGTWREMFDRGSLSNAMPLVVWYLAVQAIALLALPLTWFVCRRLADGGFALAKTVGILAIAYVPWLLASLHVLPYTRLSIVLAAMLLAVGSGIVLHRHWRTIVAWWRELQRVIVATEGLFLAAFLGFALMRAANPDLWHGSYGGEKPMDFAYLNAIIKTTWFPPYDPWMSGAYINYYYFGQVIVASLTKLTGIVPWVAYNLAIPTIAALTAINAASAAFNLLIHRRTTSAQREIWALGGGLTAAVLAVIVGNLHGLTQLVEWLAKVDRSPIESAIPGVAGTLSAVRGLVSLIVNRGQGLPPFNFDFWAPTRVITTEGTAPITEFPYFTFLYGDLHAHMIAMPLGLMVLGLAINLIRQPDWLPTVRGHHPRDILVDSAKAVLSPGGMTVMLAALAIGLIRMTNAWDYPTYIGLVTFSVLIAEVTRRRRRWDAVAWRTLVLAAFVVAASSVFIAPFLRRYELFYTGLELTKNQTTLPHYLIIMGAFLGFLGSYLVFRLWALRGRLGLGALGALGTLGVVAPMHGVVATPSLNVIRPLDRLAAGLGVVVVILGAVILLAGLPVVGISAVGLGAIGVVMTLRRPSPGLLFAFLLAATSLAVTAGVEIFVLKGDIGRMNTVFKFYLQAWLFMAVTCGVLLTLLARRATGSRWLLKGRRRWVAIAGVILGLCLFTYPVFGTPVKVQYRFVQLPWSLDGMEFMSRAKYMDGKDQDLRLSDDFAAINWMLDNVGGSPVILEGLAPIYHWRSRVSIWTGLPTVLGWDWHQKQQRGDFAYMVDDRAKDVDTAFNAPSPEIALQIIAKYGVDYIYVGGQERAFYPPTGLDKFDRMVGSSLQEAYRHGAVTIYRVMR